MLDFSTPLQKALSLSDAATQAFLRAGVANVRDLLLHLPLRYEDRSHLTPIDSLRDGQMAQIYAQVMSSRIMNARRKMLQVTIADEAENTLTLQYFHFYPSQLKQFSQHRYGLFYGKVQWSPYGYQMAHPEIHWLKADEYPELSTQLLPIYGTVKGLTQARWRQAVAKVLQAVPLPEADALTEIGFMSVQEALRTLHAPSLETSPEALLSAGHPARKRLAMEELCAHQISIQEARAQLRLRPAPVLKKDVPLLKQFLAHLPFELTSAQQRVISEISADLASSVPMLRMVQGDVGSGKTIVALCACLQAIAAGKQAAFMAPTELLAEQHAANIARLLGELPVQTVLLASKLPAKEKRARLAAIASGEAQLIIGTHALFQESVSYHDLALIVIDEQHRFGVQQRLALQEKAPANTALHQLVLSATPIPRTLAMSAYGELDSSIIDALPAGRKPVKTSVVSSERREEVIAGVRRLCAQGKQAYWVCPLIEESEVLECENAEAIAAHLQESLPELTVAMVHGRLKADERNAIMQSFAAGEIDLLVATTVIEVGVDVANASLMVIENAERFGLSQLHQLRGRVGRGADYAYCILMYQAPLGETAKKRLSIMRATTDGFRIAEEDLKIRGAGELLGTRQTGDQILKIADLERDAGLLPEVQRLIRQWQQTNPDFVDALMQRWVGEKTRYFRV